MAMTLLTYGSGDACGAKWPFGQFHLVPRTQESESEWMSTAMNLSYHLSIISEVGIAPVELENFDSRFLQLRY